VADPGPGGAALRRYGWLAAVALLLAAGLIVLVSAGSDEADNGDALAAGTPRPFFGVVPQGPLEAEDYARMGQGRVGTLRVLLTWLATDPGPAPDDYNWADFDSIVGQAASNGVEILPFLYGTPAWVATSLDGVECEGGECATFAPRSEAALDAWVDWVGAAVDRYGPSGVYWEENPDVPKEPIRAWQIWNEQNSPSFYSPAPDIEDYANLLAAAAAAIHQSDPEAQVVTGGMFGTPLKGELPAYTAWDYLDRLYAIEGAEASFDGVGSHPYAANLTKTESQVELIREAVERAGDDAGLWITEIGWASGGEDNPLNKGPDGQAQELTEAYELFLDRREEWRIETVTWYSWRDFQGEGLCVWCPDSGLFPEDELEPKPSWEAFAELTGGS
jgi:polysaccharide biosynthesis protein PslG